MKYQKLTIHVHAFSSGCEKAMDILVAILSSTGPEAWVGCESALHSLMGHTAKEFRSDMVRQLRLSGQIFAKLQVLPI